MFFDAFWYARQSFLAEQQKKAKNCVKFKVHEPYWKVDVASVCLFGDSLIVQALLWHPSQ